MGAGIPALSDATDVCVSKHHSALIGRDGDSRSSQGHRPEDIGCRAEERKPSFLALARKTTSSERSNLLMLGEANEESDGRPPRICSMEPYQITNALNLSEITYTGNLKMISDRAK